jgi:hypothetical protein
METQVKKRNIHGRFYGAIARLPGANKEDIVWRYSYLLTTSLTEFLEKNPQGYWAMVADLEQKAPFTKGEEQDRVVKNLITERTIKQKRSAILHRLQKYGIDTTDWRKVNAFLEQPRIAGKRLYDMTIDEMQDLIKKLESILKKEKKYREEIERQARLN